jgi:high-affinity nickel-transport protein
MSKALFQLFNDGPGNLKSRIISLYTVLIAANVAAWAWALIAFHDYPVLLGTCFLAYSFGLRHAVDADHIAAIDNATRKLMQEGKRPISLGLFFSLGHSTVVVLATIAVAATAATFKDELEDFHRHLGLRRLPAHHRRAQRFHPGQRLQDLPTGERWRALCRRRS